MSNMWVTSGAESPESAKERLNTPGAVHDSLLGDAIIGNAEDVGTQLAHWAIKQGVDGICLNLYDYLGDLDLIGTRAIPAFETELAAHGKTFRRPTVPEKVT